MKKAHCDIYKRVMAEVEHEVKAPKHELAKLDAIAKAIKQLREYEKGLNQS